MAPPSQLNVNSQITSASVQSDSTPVPSAQTDKSSDEFFETTPLPGGKWPGKQSFSNQMFVKPVIEPLEESSESEELDDPIDSPLNETDYRTTSNTCRQELVLCDEALYGLPRRIVKKLEPETESHPAAILIDILANFGSIIGRTAHFIVEDTPHYGNLFAVVVGETAKGRKGTARGRSEKIFAQVDRTWFDTRRVNGLSSGEGLIQEVRDERVNEKGETVDPGAKDKRLFVYEGEFAGPLVAMQRQGNSLESTIRQAWDGKPLRTLVKNSPLMATGAHISILGNITREELEIALSQSSLFNGFVNRFVWQLVRRTKIKPFGGKTLNWTTEVEELKRAVEFARNQKRVFMDHNARRLWHRVYERLSAGESGRFGAATARAEAQVRRFALLFAMLDRSAEIRVDHLRAALAFWWYCEQSARIIFGGLTDLQKRLVALLQSGPMTATKIREALHRNLSMDKILANLAALIERGLVGFAKDGSGLEKYALVNAS